MLNTLNFYQKLCSFGLDFFCGVPDSLLKDLCACITENTLPEKNIITANEGNALAVAAGHYLATNKPAVVYLQNSGLGNLINPLLSLMDEDIYKIPALLIIGWRGEPNHKDEPQHIKQGKLTLPLLEILNVKYEVLNDISQINNAYQYMEKEQKPFAFVVQKNTFESYTKKCREQKYNLSREMAIKQVVSLMSKSDVIVSSTGMISRELYENRETHEKDFLTVGSMGHASSIAFGIALSKPEKRIFCFDGDGALLMHMGALPVISAKKLSNLKHIVFNNEAHDSVGGQPTIMGNVRLEDALIPLGYQKVYCATTLDEIKNIWPEFYSFNGSCFLEIKVKCGSRADLGRPKEKPIENKIAFMNFLRK